MFVDKRYMIVTDYLSRLDFNNTEIAFQQKSDKDLAKAYWLFKLVSSPLLIKVGSPLSNFALKIGLPIRGLIRDSIYKQFCGGESVSDCQQAINQLAQAGVDTILDYSVEGKDAEGNFEANCLEILRTVAYAKNHGHIPFCVFKASGLGRFALFEKKDAGEILTAAERAEFNRIYSRIDRICAACHEAGLRVLIDAEHSWIQESIDDIARDMMEKYNKTAALVHNTYQLYRTDKLASLQADFAYAQTQNFYLGAKLVRGAYMEIERARALRMGYPSPIQKDKAACDRDYNQALGFCLNHINRIGLVMGTHNEESVRQAVKEMQLRSLSPTNPHIFFAQLLGMSDNITFNLAAQGFHVAKYMPYGPVASVMPYLARRAQENTSVGGQTGRELSLIIKEKARRKAKAEH